MGIEQKILVRGTSLGAGVASALCVVALLTACGQKGNLYMPNDPEFKQRATLPDIVRRQFPGEATAPAANPATSAASAPSSANTTNTTAPAATSPAKAASAATGR
jgi:Prokaryotic lipoprotein-attachment site